MEKKGIMDKVHLIKSAIEVADFWEVEVSELIGFVCAFVKPEKKEEWNKIAREVQEFSEMSIEDRALKVGFKLSKLKDNK